MRGYLAQVHHNFATLGENICWRYKDHNSNEWGTVTWAQASKYVQRLSEWLIEKGLKPGEKAAVWCGSRYEWTIIDLAIMSAGGVVVPVYHSLPLEQGAHNINEPECKFLFVGGTKTDEYLAEIENACPKLQGIILVESGGKSKTIPTWELKSILAESPSQDNSAYVARWSAVKSDDLLSIVYTSGTTGIPKGVELVQDNFTYELAGLEEIFEFEKEDISLMFLPLAHIVARILQCFQMWSGCCSAYAESIDKLGENLIEVRPHFLAGVPRVFEKIQAKIENHVSHLPFIKRNLFNWALKVGRGVSYHLQQNQKIPFHLELQRPVAKKILAPIVNRLGGRIKYVIAGGAPLAPETAEFFHAAGMLIIEGYGLTETTAAMAINRPNDYCFGTVGKLLNKVEVKIAEDGEILVKGPIVFRQYFKRPDETAKVKSADGWFSTGDIGEFKNGYLKITDRKKDLIKTSGGKYIAPQPIEYQVKQSPYISDVVLQGDRRRFVTALVTLDQDAVSGYIRKQGIDESDWVKIAQNPKVIDLIQTEIDKVNSCLASFETIKRFHILDHQFAVESGELTPTMKIKRNVAYSRYKDLFDQMYQE